MQALVRSGSKKLYTQSFFFRSFYVTMQISGKVSGRNIYHFCKDNMRFQVPIYQVKRRDFAAVRDAKRPNTNPSVWLKIN